MSLIERELVDEAVGVPDVEETAADFLARLRVAVETGKLPRDVGQWAVEAIEAHMPATARRMARDHHLRTAANMISGTTWAKARRLEQEILAARGLRPRRARVRPREATVGYHVRQAVEIDPEAPVSVRHLLRIIAGY